MKFIVILFLIGIILQPKNSFANCNELYLDRFDIAEKQFVDMDIADEYALSSPKIIQNKYIIKNFLKFAPRLRFSRFKEENKRIRLNLISKITNKELKAKKIINLKNQSRKAFFIQENIKDNNYYSLIFYVNLDCNPFTNKIKITKVKNKKTKTNEKKLPNNK